MINLALSNSRGDIFEMEAFRMTGSSGNIFKIPDEKEIILMPSYSQLFYLPDASPVVFDKKRGFSELNKFIFGEKLYPVSAFLPPGYLRLYIPSYIKKSKRNLPLWAYTAIGIKDGKLFAAATRIDYSKSWDPETYDDGILLKKIEKRIRKDKKNRLLKQLRRCALNYHCFTAKNVFLEKNECAIPVSKFCNASCCGCISSISEFGFPPSQHRIDFTPSLNEILEVALYHIDNVRDSIISFGQGCEGEPLLETGLIEKAITEIRRITKKGTININTNGSIPENFEKLCKAGLDSCRISINSTQNKRYQRYFRPVGFGFKDVIKSIRIAKENNVFVSINLLTFPGITDEKKEAKGLIKLIKETKINMVQFRNLNIDPYLYLKIIKPVDKAIGLINLIRVLKGRFPRLKIGYFNIPKNKFSV